MRHLFIINRHAGSQSCEYQVLDAIHSLTTAIDYDIYVKQRKGDSEELVREYRRQYPNEELRVYACGGDGTLSEVAGAMVGVENIAFTSLPFGSGNDYIKYYGTLHNFRNLDRLVHGTVVPIDIMKVNDKYALNATHFGLDYKVACTMHRLRRNILVGKQLCYPSAITWVFLTGMTAHCQVIADGIPLNEYGSILLCTIANGRYVGGSYCCAPLSCNDDGWLEVCLIKPVSRWKILQLINAYKRGEHLNDVRFEPYVTYRRAKNIVIKSDDARFGIALDGETVQGNRFTVDVLHHAVRFIVP
ncbi:MAG: hypothetical protein IKM35_04330 [Bacteroidaceae bacterium]|nr:hypothetical protein [Bacteroidaceae bacterium]